MKKKEEKNWFINIMIFLFVLLPIKKSIDKNFFKFSVYSKIKKRIKKVYEIGWEIIKGIGGLNIGFNSQENTS